MSVFVKGMNMPRSCWECDLHCFRDNGFRDKEEIQWGPKPIIPEDFRCGGNNEWHETNEFDFLNERHPDCPIVEIPTPHGDLVDRDDLIDEINRVTFVKRYDYDVAYNIVTDAETIIEAEVSE